MNRIEQHEECGICFENFSKDQAVLTWNYKWEDIANSDLADSDLTPVMTKCHHVFCNSCLHSWVATFKEKTTIPPCPTCRGALMETPAICNSFQLGVQRDFFIMDAEQERVASLINRVNYYGAFLLQGDGQFPPANRWNGSVFFRSYSDNLN